MFHGRLVRAALLAMTLGNLAAFSRDATAELYINEVFFNPGGQALDSREEYIELRGTPNASLENYYLLFIEGDDDVASLGEAGSIDNVFDLNFNPTSATGQSLGSNGFMTLRQKNTKYAVRAGTNDRVNQGSGSGFGSGVGSTIGATDTADSETLEFGTLENSSFTVMLIQNTGGLAPYVGLDLDVNNDGLDSAETAVDGWRSKWTIVDSIGIAASVETEDSEFARLYGNINFFADFAGAPLPPTWEPRIEPGAEHEVLYYEFEYAARWGNSTGQTADDWHLSNLTDNFGSGYINNTFLLRQSCIDMTGCHATNDNNHSTPPPLGLPTESNKAVPYGTILTESLGAPNYMTGDYNKDGYVDAADYTAWRDSVGTLGSEFVIGQTPLVHNHPKADGNHDFLVDATDYEIWKASFPGAPGAGAGAGGGALAVPEPASWLLAMVVAAAVAARRSRV